jgi:hypothetical protein
MAEQLGARLLGEVQEERLDQVRAVLDFRRACV